MAAKKKAVGAKKKTAKATTKRVVKTAKAVKSKAAKTAKATTKAAQGTALVGEALVLYVLSRLKITPQVASATNPSESTAPLFLDAARTIAAYAKAQRVFAKIRTFKTDVADAGAALLDHAKKVNRSWQKLRFAKRKGENRASLREEAEELRASFLKTGRFLFRDDPDSLAEVNRIAEGEGLPDLIQDMEDIVEFARLHEELFAEEEKLIGMARKAQGFAEALKRMTDGELAAAQMAARNRATVALERCLAEIRSSARYLYDGNPKALVPFLSSSAPRVRASRGNKKKAAEAKPKKPSKPVEPSPDDE